MLIIKLNRALEIYTISELSQDLKFSLTPKPGQMLELFNHFESIWKNIIWTEIKNQNSVRILLIVGPKAGFTDTRILTVWLNSLSLFCNSEKEILFSKYLEYRHDPDLPEYTQNNLSSIIENLVWTENIDSSVYTREPSINL